MKIMVILAASLILIVNTAWSQLEYSDLTTIALSLNQPYSQNNALYLNLIATLQQKGYILLTTQQSLSTTTVRPSMKQNAMYLAFTSLSETISPKIEITSSYTTETGKQPITTVQMFIYTSDFTQYSTWITSMKSDPLCIKPLIGPFSTSYTYNNGGIDISNTIGFGIKNEGQQINTTNTLPPPGGQQTVTGIKNVADQPYKYFIFMTVND
jgi:hypothetical protein